MTLDRWASLRSAYTLVQRLHLFLACATKMTATGAIAFLAGRIFSRSICMTAGAICSCNNTLSLRAPAKQTILQAMKQPAVYILANRKNGALYAGVTSNLLKRIWQHKNGIASGFAFKHGCKLLVWYELHETMASAILREKQIKAGSRMAKGILISVANSEWRDLYEDLF